MQSTPTFTQLPTETFTADVSDHEVMRLDEGVNELTGPVVVGGRCGADCFRYGGELHAGLKDPEPDYTIPFVSGAEREPRKLPW